MNKIAKLTTLLLSTSLLIASCSSNNVKQDQDVSAVEAELEVEKEELIEHEHQASINSQEPTGEVIIDMLPRIQIVPAEPEQPQRIEQRELSHSERFTGMLEAHNSVREKHNVPPLNWSKKLEDYSMQWAKHLSRGQKCDMYHRTNDTPYGENLYRSTAIVWTDGKREINPVTIKDVVKAWTDEEKWYNYKKNTCQPGAQCGHYTQAVWNTTTEVGCAMQVCADKSQVWVCSYNPPGNYRGVRPY